METLHTYKEILQQPACWLKEYAVLVEQKAAIQAFLAKYLTPETDIVLTGAGTSAFIGDAIAPVLRGAWKNVRAVATTDIVTNAADYLNADKPLLLISFARSGNSPESVATVNLANKVCKNIAHIFITCNKNGHLAKSANAENILSLLLPEETDDKSLAMTSSFSTMLLTCLMLSKIDTIENEKEAVEATAANAQAILEQYIADIVFATRYPERYGLKGLKDMIAFGGSPRASINLAKASRAYAFIKRRGYVVPEDVRAVAHDVLRHRIGLTYEAEASDMTSEEIVSKIINKVEVP